MWAATGDTATAIALLDRTLGELPRYDPQILEDVAHSAAAVTAMMLRADLAAAAGDTSAARRWSTAVMVLRERADPVLQHQVQRMSRYAGAR
jgi:hypothetical protein